MMREDRLRTRCEQNLPYLSSTGMHQRYCNKKATVTAQIQVSGSPEYMLLFQPAPSKTHTAMWHVDFSETLLMLWHIRENERRCSLLGGRIWHQIFPSLHCFVPTGFRMATGGQSAAKQMMLWRGNHGNYTTESVGSFLWVVKCTPGKDMKFWLPVLGTRLCTW